MTAQIFDPFVFKDYSIWRLNALADKLVNFGYDKYCTINTIPSLKISP